MNIEEFKETNLYNDLLVWLTTPYDQMFKWFPTDSEIEIAKHVWILSEKNNSDFVLSKLNSLGYFD